MWRVSSDSILERLKRWALPGIEAAIQLARAYPNDDKSHAIEQAFLAMGAPPKVMGEKVLAIYIGVTGRLDEDQVLVEIIKFGDAPHLWSYRAYDITGPQTKHYETKTVGHLKAPELGDIQPPRFIMDQFQNRWWRRVR